MPLAFKSLSHGTVAFGFYNIGTDSLLCENHFFFCTDFCRAVTELEEGGGEGEKSAFIPGWRFEDRRGIGDLMGSIRGVSHGGYLGEIYLKWPFPEAPEDFRQRIHGAETRPVVEEILDRRAKSIEMELKRGKGSFSLGPCSFDEKGYLALISYVWKGGYPTWEGFEAGRKPECVLKLAPYFPRLSGTPNYS